MYDDGIFRLEKGYSKCFKFNDINYMVASQDDQLKIIEAYCNVLNALTCGADTKITVFNNKMSRSIFEESILMRMNPEDFLDELRKEYNEIILDKSMHGNGILQEKYLTVTIHKPSLEAARNYFAQVNTTLSTYFTALGSKLVPLNLEERVRIFHTFFRSEEANSYKFDPVVFATKGYDPCDYFSPDSIKNCGDYLMIGKKYARVLSFLEYGSFIRDTVISELTEFSRSMMLSIDIIPVPSEEAAKAVQESILRIESDIAAYQRRQNNNNNYSAIIPHEYKLMREETQTMMDELTCRNQRMMMTVITIVHVADTKEELDSDTDALRAISQTLVSQLIVLDNRQIDGLMTALPYGVRRINHLRSFTTQSVAAFIPFKVQEIMEKDGLYFGENAISHNLIMCNLAKLMNQSMMIMGIPGSGKSFCAKLLILILCLITNDDILICDPEGEYATMMKHLDSVSSIIRIIAGGKDRINVMNMAEGYGQDSDVEVNPIVAKSQFIMSMIDQIAPGKMGPQHKSIIDRCIASIFKDAEKTGNVPTLNALRLALKEQPEAEAQDIALSLELYTVGSLDIFGHESNIDLDKRVIVFDINGLGEQLKPVGLLVITDTMINRVLTNWRKGKRTHVFIDEFHVVFENAYSAAFFNSAWRQFRKRNAYPCAITQNVEYILDTTHGKTMLSNSEFLVLLNQSPADRANFAKVMGITNEQLSYVTNADPGCGLIKFGGNLVPFENRFPKNTKMYQLMTTKPGEGVFSEGQV